MRAYFFQLTLYKLFDLWYNIFSNKNYYCFRDEDMDLKRKNSVKRTAILAALAASKAHPTAEALYAALKPEYPDLSLGTVYRNLGQFCEEGRVLSVCHVDGKERFDARLDGHAHLVCSKCRRVLDVELPEGFSGASYDICRNSGFVPASFSLVFTGLCSECKAAEKQENN